MMRSIILALATLMLGCQPKHVKAPMPDVTGVGYVIQYDPKHPNHCLVYYINERAFALARASIGCGKTMLCHEQHIGLIYVETENIK